MSSDALCSDAQLREITMYTALRFAIVFAIVFYSSAFGQEWRPLFDGQSLDGWVTQDRQPVDATSWEVRDGMLHLDHLKGDGGNLLTDQDYGDFELSFEWKVAPKANNGIKYRVQDFDGRTLGLEYQVIDDAGLPQLKPNHKTASIYDIYDVKEHSLLKPAGEFNRGRIVVNHNRIEHWLNGQLVAEAEVGSDQWQQRIADSKFSDVDGFGLNHFGRIMITDHHDEVWYRNIFIRDLSPRFQAVAASTSHGCCCPQETARRGLFRRMARRR